MTYVKPKLDAIFSCLFCNHEKSVICTLDKRSLIGFLKCKVCGQTFQTTISSLSAPVDVYSDWVDACEDINNDKTNEKEENGEGDIQEVGVEEEDEDYDDSD